MNRKTVKMICLIIPVSSWRKKMRKRLVYHFVLSNEEKTILKKQKELYNAVINSVDKNSVCIDCGANIGQETIPWAERGAEVYAFEPHPECFKILTEKTARYNKVHLYEKGVWYKNSTMNLYFREGTKSEEISESSSLLKSKPNVDEENYIKVEIIDLVEFIRGLNKRIDILKIDIEGAEVELIQKIIDTKIYEDIGLVLVETHEQIPEIAEGIQDLRQLVANREIKNINLEWR